MVCIIAAIGFAFDIYELLMLPLIIKPAVASLSAPLIDEMVKAGMSRPDAIATWLPGGSNYVFWARLLFFVPAVAGGIFGLWGGWLTDRLGRRRVLTLAFCFTPLVPLPLGSQPHFLNYCSFAAACLWAFVSNSSLRSLGLRSCFRFMNNVNECSAGHKRFHRSAA